MASTWDMLNDELAFQANRFKGMGQALGSGLMGLLSTSGPTPAFGTQSPAEAADNPVNPVDRAAGVAASLPMAAYGVAKNAVDAAQTYRDTGYYDPAPIVQAATIPMGTGAAFGVPAAAGDVLLGAGATRKLPPLLETLHATGGPTEFSYLKPPPETHDLGMHSTVTPSATEGYYEEPGANKSKWMKQPDDPTQIAGPRTKPFLTDVRSAVKFPEDAIKWNDPNRVVNTLQWNMQQGFQAPRGLLSDLRNISGSDAEWQKSFIPVLKDRGYDALLYPHSSEGGPRYNTFMAFDPEQNIPKFSPEGQQAIKERGVYPLASSGLYGDPGKWRLPKGVLAKPEAMESLLQDPRKNTFRWWEDPSDPMNAIHEDVQQKTAAVQAGLSKAAKEKMSYWQPFHDYIAKNPGVDYPPGFNPFGVGMTPQGAVDLLKMHNINTPDSILKVHPDKEWLKAMAIKNELPFTAKKYGLDTTSFDTLKDHPMYGNMDGIIKSVIPGFKPPSAVLSYGDAIKKQLTKVK